MGKILACRDVGFAYADRPVLRGVRLDVVPGRVSVLVGPSGSGKTTLLWILAGLIRPTTGRVLLCEFGDGSGAGRPFDARRERLGMVFQTPALWDHLTVEGHLALVSASSGLARTERRRRADRMLDRMRLASLRGRRPATLSGGERQRLAIARALVSEPDWLLLDEPLAHLDGPARADVFGLLRDALTGTRAGVLLATHNTAEALRLADEVAVLLGGVVAQAGDSEDVYCRPVSLAVAQTLGPAGELRGEAAGGVLTCGGTVILEGLARDLAGPRRLIVRPEDVTFRADPAGSARVVRSERVGGSRHLLVEVTGVRLWVQHPRACQAGTAGRLALAGRD